MIMSKQVQIKSSQVPEDWSLEAADLINRLLQRKPLHRLGLSGSNEVKKHQWFKEFNWKALKEKTLKSPFIPAKGDNFDSKYCSSADEIGEETQERYMEIYQSTYFQEVFNGFFYVKSTEYKKIKGKNKNSEFKRSKDIFKQLDEHLSASSKLDKIHGSNLRNISGNTININNINIINNELVDNCVSSTRQIKKSSSMVDIKKGSKKKLDNFPNDNRLVKSNSQIMRFNKPLTSLFSYKISNDLKKSQGFSNDNRYKRNSSLISISALSKFTNSRGNIDRILKNSKSLVFGKESLERFQLKSNKSNINKLQLLYKK